MKSRNVAADRLRVASIFYIIGFWHLTGYGHVLPDGAPTQVAQYITVLCLALFTFLSGYFIGKKEIKSRLEAIRFYKSRFFGIFIPYWATIGLFFLFGIGSHDALLRGALLVGMFDEPPPGTLWFANMIIIFYIVAPLIIVMFSRNRLSGLTLCLFLEGALFVADQIFGTLDGRLMLYFPSFAAGIMLSNADIRSKSLIPIISIAIIAIVITRSLPEAMMESSPSMIPWALFSSLAVIVFALYYGSDWKGGRMLSFLIRASFFMYIGHRIIYRIVLKGLHPQTPGEITALLLFVGLPATVLLAWLAQVAYDKILVEIGLTDRTASREGRRHLVRSETVGH